MPECEPTCAPSQGLACCFGICAITHLEDTLAQLEDFVRSDVFRKSTSIFSIFKVRRAITQNCVLVSSYLSAAASRFTSAVQWVLCSFSG